MKNTYWKALSSTFIVAMANYWFGELFYAFYTDFSNDTDDNDNNLAKTLSQQMITVAFFFPNVFLLLPILGGILIDYIGVIPILQYLNIVYVIGAALFALAFFQVSLWTFILSSLFFGFSLVLSYIATYVYLCNTFLTKTKDIKYFRLVLGIYIGLSYALVCLPLLIKSADYSYIKLGFGGFLVVIALILSFFLKVKPIQQNAALSTNPLDISNISVSKVKSFLFTSAETIEGTFVEHNEKYSQDQVNSTSFKAFLKEGGLISNLKILSLAVITGISQNINAERTLDPSLEKMSFFYVLHYATYVIFGGLVLPFIKWRKAFLERAIIIGLSFYVLSIILAGIPISLPFVAKIIIYAVQNITTAVNFYTVYLYFPFVIDFKVGNMGKAVGLFWWIVSLEMFLGTWLDQDTVSLEKVSYDTVIILPAVLALVIFAVVVRIEDKRSLSLKYSSSSVPISI